MKRTRRNIGGAKMDIGTTIISMLEVAESDLNTLLAEVHEIAISGDSI